MPPNLLQTPPAAPARPRLPLRVLPDSYVTDEVNLYRCVSAEMTGDPEGTALLEECRTLETFVVPLATFAESGLRVVRA